VGGTRVEGGQWTVLGATKGYRGMVEAVVVPAKIDVGKPNEGWEMASGQVSARHRVTDVW